jgi:predicted transcriptional regulator
VHYLYHNQFDGEYLLPEFKHMDFLWLMKGYKVEEEKCNWIKQSVKTISGVQLVVELTNEQIKAKGNMVF